MDRLLTISNSCILGFIIALILSALIAYPWAEAFPLSIQILAHIGTLVFAIGIKVSYIARLAALKNLGRPVD